VPALSSTHLLGAFHSQGYKPSHREPIATTAVSGGQSISIMASFKSVTRACPRQSPWTTTAGAALVGFIQTIHLVPGARAARSRHNATRGLRALLKQVNTIALVVLDVGDRVRFIEGA
jgi:hypothetical protein